MVQGLGLIHIHCRYTYYRHCSGSRIVGLVGFFMRMQATSRVTLGPTAVRAKWKGSLTHNSIFTACTGVPIGKIALRDLGKSVTNGIEGNTMSMGNNFDLYRRMHEIPLVICETNLLLGTPNFVRNCGTMLTELDTPL